MRMAGWVRTVATSGAALILASCHPASGAAGADPSSCAAPPAWNPPGAKPGQPDAEIAACLKNKAYDIRSLAIPMQSAVQGVIAQCEVEVDRFEGQIAGSGASDADQKAREQTEEQEATAALTQYRVCPSQ